jgi:hypothetical protein
MKFHVVFEISFEKVFKDIQLIRSPMSVFKIWETNYAVIKSQTYQLQSKAPSKNGIFLRTTSTEGQNKPFPFITFSKINDKSREREIDVYWKLINLR